ncbi:MAG: hypothetical protein AB1726_00210 [Planctomycetota bacterium]
MRTDLLACRPVRRLVRAAGFPVAVQAFALAVVIALACAGLGIGASSSASELMLLRKTNLATLIVWGMWWPAMVALAIGAGRAWCTVCPMELVNRIGHGLAGRLGWPRARLGRVLRAGWLIVTIYVVMQLLVAGFSIHRVPHFTAVLLLVLGGGALLAGLVFREPRSFCIAFCPAGALLSVYGRLTPLQLEMRDPAVCAGCSTKDCVRAGNRRRFNRQSCPSRLRPFDREPADACVLCLQCAKVCPHDNVGFGLVAKEAPIRRKTLLRPAEAAFVLVALGFVSHEVIGEVKWLDEAFHVVPAGLASALPGVPFAWFEALWFLVLFPLMVWFAVVGLGRLAGHRGGIRPLLLAAATGAAPVVAVAHLAKAAAKVTAWGGFLPLALRDPRGSDTLHRIADHSLVPPAPFLSLTVIGWAMCPLVLFVTWRVWCGARRIRADAIPATRAGLIGASVLFTSVLTVWSWVGR